MYCFGRNQWSREKGGCSTKATYFPEPSTMLSGCLPYPLTLWMPTSLLSPTLQEVHWSGVRSFKTLVWWDEPKDKGRVFYFVSAEKKLNPNIAWKPSFRLWSLLAQTKEKLLWYALLGLWKGELSAAEIVQFLLRWHHRQISMSSLSKCKLRLGRQVWVIQGWKARVQVWVMHMNLPWGQSASVGQLCLYWRCHWSPVLTASEGNYSLDLWCCRPPWH